MLRCCCIGASQLIAHHEIVDSHAYLFRCLVFGMFDS